MALIVPLRSSSQTYRSRVDPRFTLNVSLKDTTVTQPYSTFLASAAKRLVADTLISEKKENIHRLNSMLDAKVREVVDLRKGIEALEKDNHSLQLKLQEGQEGLMECARKRERLKTFATIGKVTVYGGLAVAALLIYTKTAMP